jgi:hypothetical protein
VVVVDRWTASAVVVVGGFAVAAGLAEVVAAVVAAEAGGRNTASEAGRAVESLNRGSEVITKIFWFLGF